MPRGQHQRHDPSNCAGLGDGAGARHPGGGGRCAGARLPYVDLHGLGCDFYAASAHKWLLSPKGVVIFYARHEAQHLLKPLVVAAKWEDRSIRRFENYNTCDLPEVLGLGETLDFQRLFGPARTQQRILGLKQRLREALAGDPRFPLKTPAPDTLSAGITTVEVVGREVREMGTALSERHRIDCRPVSSHGLNGLRISLCVFNGEDQVELLLQGMREPA